MNDQESYRILLVDDERMYRDMLQKTLRMEGYEVDTASDGEEAVRLIRSSNFDIIVTDLAMPGVDGMEVLRAAKQVNESTVVIIITGYASLDTALKAIKDGVYDYITKPFQLEEIKLTLKNAREKIDLMRENEDLIGRLQMVHDQVAQLSSSRREYEQKIAEIDGQLVDRQKEITNGMRRLRGFHDRVMPAQFKDVNKQEANGKKAVALKDVVQLWKDGTINEEEFKELKKQVQQNET